jgi:hypothetical protein
VRQVSQEGGRGLMKYKGRHARTCVRKTCVRDMEATFMLREFSHICE